MKNVSALYPPVEIGHSYSSLALVIDVVLISVIIVSIFGNLLIIAALSKNKDLRKPSNIFIGSLAIADLLIAIIIMPFSLSTHLVDHRFFKDPAFCNLYIAFDILFCSTSLLHLCLISVDRYIAIKKPMVYRSRMSKAKASMASVVAWLVCALKSMVPVNLNVVMSPKSDLLATMATGLDGRATNFTGHTVYINNTSLSSEDSVRGWHLARAINCDQSFNVEYAIITSIVDFLLPCLLMSFFYARIFLLVRQRAKALRAGRIPTAKKNESEMGNASSGNHGDSELRISRQHASDSKALVLLGSIMGLFIVCWTPFFVNQVTCALIQTLHCNSLRSWVAELFTWLGYFNSCLNPFVYAITNKDFRTSFKDILMFRNRIIR